MLLIQRLPQGSLTPYVRISIVGTVVNSRQYVDKERFLHFHGELGARLDRKDSAFEPSTQSSRSIAFMCISPFLFFMPLVYLKELERTYVDNSVHYYYWRQFIEGLKRDWENSITPVRTFQITLRLSF